MSIPLFPEKINEKSIVHPEELFQPNGVEIPRALIFCFQRSLFQHVMAKFPCKKGPGGLVQLGESGRVGIVTPFGQGAPAAVLALERWIAMGASRFMTIGSAGALQREIDVGSWVICEKALRDEGVSYHYLEKSLFAYPHSQLTQEFLEVVSESGEPHCFGSCWTTDAPYRETAYEVQRHQESGVKVVDMEAAALFAVAQYRGVEIGSAFVVSDSLANHKWEPQFGSEKVKRGLEKFFALMYEFLER